MTSQTVSRCPVCNSSVVTPVADEKFHGRLFRIARCRSCDALFTSYREADHNIDYSDQDEAAFEKKYLPVLRGIRKHDRHENYLEEVSIIKKYSPGGRLLDVGCHAGWLLSYLQPENRWELFGLEPSPFLAQLTARRLGIRVYNNSLREGVLEKDRFDFICLTDVLEHLSDPQMAVRVLRDGLKDGGRLLIKVPNGGFALLKNSLRRLFGFLLQSPEVFDAKEHHVLYSRKALHLLLEGNGFRILETRIPKPVQPGSSSAFTRGARKFIYHLGRTGVLPAQDLLVVAQVSK